jgi:hypothetical protein
MKKLISVAALVFTFNVFAGVITIEPDKMSCAEAKQMVQNYKYVTLNVRTFYGRHYTTEVKGDSDLCEGKYAPLEAIYKTQNVRYCHVGWWCQSAHSRNKR